VINLSNLLIPPGKTIGIVGGGQLGRMIALSAKEMGYYIAVLEPTEDSPCGQVADIKVIGNYDDRKAVEKLAEVSGQSFTSRYTKSPFRKRNDYKA
jgi:5-(carboxyamino)imidazole ribonucleotide synthase